MGPRRAHGSGLAAVTCNPPRRACSVQLAAGPVTESTLDASDVAKARVLFGHAALQFVADAHGIDLLHIKGYALDPSLTRESRISTDVDVVVRPAHVARLLDALQTNGWVRSVGFQAGSPFGHAATLHHELWGYADIHRFIPGINRPASEAFDTLWAARKTLTIAEFRCPVPGPTAQRLIQLMHAARSEHRIRASGDIDTAWGQASPAQQQDVRRLAASLDAEVALAAAIGELEHYQHRRDYALWRSVSQGGTRTGEWWARIRAAPNVGAALRIAARAPLVNVEHLAVQLGRRPTTREVVHEFVARPLRGVAEIPRWLRGRLRR